MFKKLIYCICTMLAIMSLNVTYADIKQEQIKSNAIHVSLSDTFSTSTRPSYSQTYWVDYNYLGNFSFNIYKIGDSIYQGNPELEHNPNIKTVYLNANGSAVFNFKQNYTLASPVNDSVMVSYDSGYYGRRSSSLKTDKYYSAGHRTNEEGNYSIGSESFVLKNGSSFHVDCDITKDLEVLVSIPTIMYYQYNWRDDEMYKVSRRFRPVNKKLIIPFSTLPKDFSYEDSIRVRKDTPEKIPFTVEVSHPGKVTVVSPSGRVVGKNVSVSPTNKIIYLDKDKFVFGKENYKVIYETGVWKLEDTVQVDVDKEAYQHDVVYQKVQNGEPYKVYATSDKILYITPYARHFDTNISNIKNQSIYSYQLSSGMNTLNLASTMHNKTFIAYIVKGNHIEQKYFLSINAYNNEINAYRNEDKVVLNSSVGISEINRNGIVIYNNNTSLIGDIVIALNEFGKADVKYEMLYSDFESDPLKAVRYYLEHSVKGFENHQGVSQYHEKTLKEPILSFNKVGIYDVKVKVQDNATSINETDFLDYDKWSVEMNKKIVVHRKPIAKISANYTKVPNSHLFKVYDIPTDGYDIDHLSQANKGIIKTQTEWKPTTESKWITGKPENRTLSLSETYIVRHRVKDQEKTWSDWAYAYIDASKANEIKLETVLSPSYPNALEIGKTVQITATVYSGRPVSVVSGMFYTGPENDYSKKYILNSNVTFKKVSQVGDKSVWTGTYIVSKEMKDADYYFLSHAINDKGRKATDQDKMKVVSNRPPTVSITGRMPSNLIYEGQDVTLFATPTDPDKDKLTVEYFVKAPNAGGYAKVQTLTNQESGKSITLKSINKVVPGTYNVKVVATDPSGKKGETRYAFTVNVFHIEGLNIYGDWYHWHGQRDKITGQTLLDNKHRFMSHENMHIDFNVKGGADYVTISISPELSSMVYTNKKGQTYYHKDFGFPTTAFPITLGAGNTYKVEYILPLADWTLNFDNIRQRAPYKIEITAYKGEAKTTVVVDDIELTGNIHDLIYYQLEEN